ncbi:MAG: PTS sugar transporter subunit IIA [Planctomycetes bacterium]|nr:PTS sugar transporter subunit IIA [Planctomycetota bacterium]
MQTNQDTFISVNNIILEPTSEEHDAVIAALVESLVSSGRVPASDEAAVKQALAERESKGSTAIGNGLAIPHARLSVVDTVIGAYARLRNGSGFNPLDGGNVQHVFLILSPMDQQATHLQTLTSIARMMKDNETREAISASKDAAEIAAMFASMFDKVCS